MNWFLVPSALLLCASGCVIDGYCSDVAGAPSCASSGDDAPPSGNGGGGGPSGNPPAGDVTGAVLLPIELGDQRTTAWIATGGAAERQLRITNLTNVAVSFRSLPLAPQPSGGWLLREVSDTDALSITAAITPTNAPYKTTLPLHTRPVADLALAPSAGYLRGANTAPAFLSMQGDPAPIATLLLLSAADDRLVDISTKLDASATAFAQVAWDRIRLPATAGTYALTLTGDSFASHTVDVAVVDHLDRLTSSAHGVKQCFHAITEDREVFAAWTVTVDGVAVDTSGGNCVTAPSTATIVARTGGRELTVSP